MSFITQHNGDGFVHTRRKDHAYDLGFELRGTIAPFLEVTLDPGEGLICDHASVLQHNFGLVIKPWPGLGGGRWLVVNSQSPKEESVMLTTIEPGFVGSFELSKYGGQLICLAGNLMANGPGVTCSFYARFQKLGLSLVLLKGNGWVFLRSCGDVFEYQMAPGETLCMRAGNVAALTATVNYEPVVTACGIPEKNSKPDFVKLTGPGIVWMQSVSRVSEPRLPVRAEPEHQVMQKMRTGGLAFLNRTSA